MAMTKVKKVLGMMMAALLCFALTPTAAFATSGDLPDQDDGTIKVTNAQPGEEYNLYKLADLVASSDNTSFIYTAINGTEGFWERAANGDVEQGIAAIPGIAFDAETMKIDVTGDLTPQAEALAKIAATQLVPFTDNLKLNETRWMETCPTNANTDANTVVFNGLSNGYYFLASSTGTICSLTSMNNKAEVKEKNDVPTLKKQVSDEGTDNWVDANSASVGDIVDFKSKIKIPRGNKGVVYHDAMDTGLELVADENGSQQGAIKVHLSDENGTKLNEELNGTLYNVQLKTSTEGTDETPTLENCTFEVEFTDDLMASYGDRFSNDEFLYVVIVYSAQVTAKAIEAITNTNPIQQFNGNLVNTAKVTYGNEGTLESLTETFLGSLLVNKVDGAGNPLAGAEFDLAGLRFVLDTTWTKDEIPTYRPALDSEDATTLTSPEGGVFRVTGLKQGSYTLSETKAPQGYNMATAPTTIDVDPKYENDDPNEKLIGLMDGSGTVVNNSGAELPSTGGMGTTILYIVGGILVVAAIAFLAVRRRSSAK